ncbi:hypothetical protein MLD38_005948 [Melastoma candidum]|uniref:Uncharacterized protein n=1 Tax=Melastoma candidum TaxID=119954 RepID=A0ACB9RQH3_9MYRT|nr:hypothetical protein MLD38_005948 [Melastoma candidum]
MEETTTWPSPSELQRIRETVARTSGRKVEEVLIAASPYRICPLGAHIDHQGGTVSAMTINRGILLGFVPSRNRQVHLCSAQFKGEVQFSIDEITEPSCANDARKKVYSNGTPSPREESNWGNYARGAVYALQSRGQQLSQGIIGYISGNDGLDSSGLSSSAAVGVAYLLAFEKANNLNMSPTDNIEYDRIIENEYLGLKNGILDQSAILLSMHGCLTYMNCKTKEHKLVKLPDYQKNGTPVLREVKILLAFSGLKQALTTNPGYNRRVDECREAASFLLQAIGKDKDEPILSNVPREIYESHKSRLEPNLAKRAEHYFSENMRVVKGSEAWALGKWDEFGKMISASGASSIENYECGSEPLKQLYRILLAAPGVLGARFSGAGFRGCCLALVYADKAEEAASYVRLEYLKCQPVLSSHLNPDTAVLICETGDGARVI